MSSDFLFFPEVISKQQEQDFLCKILSENETKPEEWTVLKRRRLILAGACPTQQQDPNSTIISQTPIHPFITGELLEMVNKKLAENSQFCQRLDIQLPISLQQKDSDDDDNNNNKLNILINEYRAPNGILFHTDGPAYRSCVCIISMESTIPIIFTSNEIPSAANTTKREEASIYDDDADDESEDEADSAEEDDKVENTSWKNWMKRSALISKLAKSSDLCSSQLQDARLANPQAFAALLPPRSMIVFSGTLYTHYLHGILENQIDLLPLNKIANLNQVLLTNTSRIIEFAVNPSKNIEDEQKESSLFHFLSLLSQIKSLDRVDMMQKTGLNAEIQKVKKDLFGDNGDFMIVLARFPTEKYLLSVRQERRISLTYRRVI